MSLKNITLVFVLLGQMVFAQQKQMNLEDAVYGRYTYLRPSTLEGVAWKTDADFTYIKDNALWVESAKSGDKSQLLTVSELNEILTEGVKTFPGYSWLNDKEMLLTLAGSFIVFDTDTRSLVYRIDLPAGAENAVFNEAGKFVVFTRGDDLFVAHVNGDINQVTSDGGKGIVNGKTVHRNEFGISGGIYNSPKGNYIAFYRKDETMVKDYPLVDFMARQAEHAPVKYPMAGMKSHHVQLGIYSVKTGKTIFLKTGEPLDHYLTNVSWAPDENTIYMAELNREQNHMQLNAYAVQSGEKIKTLFEEKAETYVEPLYPIQFSTENENEFYYLSRKEGWFHIYKYNTNGELIKKISNGNWEVTKILGFDVKEKNVFVEGTYDSPLEIQIYKLDVKTGEAEKLSDGAGVHRALLSPGANWIIDSWNGFDIPNRVDMVSAKGKLQRNLYEAKDPLENYELGENTLITLKTKDGKTDLHGRLIKPVNFDPNKKYPVVVYVYGGPHSQQVNKGWHNSARWWQYYMASKGYIAFTLDNRGTNHRGRDFETAIHRQLGMLETEDQMQGIEFLKSLPYVDQERIGVHGWSYGGFMTLNLMLHHNDVFKVGVAGGPVVDWDMYEIMYGERYMDMPQENPEGYEKTDMSKYIPQLKGKLMLIHGVQDKTVVMQHSMKFLRESVKQNKQVDFFAYPVHPHNVRGKDRVHLMEKVSRYFLENL